MANFALILQKKNNYLRLLGVYGGLAALMYLLATIITFHYAYGLTTALIPNVPLYSFSLTLGTLLTGIGNIAYVFNIFIDLFLCSLTFYFLNYEPKKIFTGKKIMIFRSFVIFPILYEIASIVIKALTALNVIMIPSFVFFLLTSKPAILFVVFLVLIIGMKMREKQYKKRFKNEKEYSEHEQTNAHTFRVSISLTVLFVIGAIVDFIIAFMIAIIFWISKEGTMDASTLASASVSFANNIGFGTAAPILMVAPILLLFSYKKTHKNPNIDIIIPVVGVGLIALVYIEGLYQVITLNLPDIIAKIINIVAGLSESEGEAVSESVSHAQEAVRMVRGSIHM